MLSSQSQFARACRALCTAAAMCLLPQGAAWAADYQVTLDPPNGFQIIETPFIVTFTVKPVYPSVPAGARPRPTGIADIRFNSWLAPMPVDAKGRACTQVDDYQLANGQNYAGAYYRVDGVARGYGDAFYNYDPTRARAKSPRVRADSAAQPGQHLTMTTLTTTPSNPVPGPYITLSAQVTDCENPTTYPQGNVDFCNTTNDHWLGAVNTDAVGVANLTLPVASGLSIGSNIVTAKFTPANASWGMSTDQATVRVQPPPQAKAKGKAKTVSRPYINCSGSIVGEKPIRRGMRPQAPPGKGTR